MHADQLSLNIATTEKLREAAFRLRYKAYLAQGAIKPHGPELFKDEYDDKPTTAIFVVMTPEGEAVGTLRFTIETLKAQTDKSRFPNQR